MEYLDGRPVCPDDVNDKFLERTASYCAFIRTHFPSSLTVTLDEMQEMILENVREGMGWNGANVLRVPAGYRWSITGWNLWRLTAG
jgi:uncharacterized phage protein gp47/JayE